MQNLRLKTEKETKDNEINNLKRLLIEKEEEMEALLGELEKLKEGYHNLNKNFSETAGQLESLETLEKKYKILKEEYNKLAKENIEHKNGALKNAKIVNAMKQKMCQKDDDIKCLINEKENLKHEILDLKGVENKFNVLCEENEELKIISEKYDNLRREYDLLMTKIQKKKYFRKRK